MVGHAFGSVCHSQTLPTQAASSLAAVVLQRRRLPWRQVERDALKRHLMGLGLGRWREVSGMTARQPGVQLTHAAAQVQVSPLISACQRMLTGLDSRCLRELLKAQQLQVLLVC